MVKRLADFIPFAYFYPFGFMHISQKGNLCFVLHRRTRIKKSGPFTARKVFLSFPDYLQDALSWQPLPLWDPAP